MRVNGYPEQVVIDLILKDWDEVPEQNLVTEQKPSEPKQNELPMEIPVEEENPWDDGPEFDIY